MKRILFCITLLTLTSCSFSPTEPPIEEPVDLGVPALENEINFNPITNKITATLTPGAVYVLQAIGIDGNVMDSKPIEFGDDISIDDFDLIFGSYDLHLVDNRGHFTKTILLVR
tara:strand:+ start:738 stop:1079 length:342 start_codon:yes stop_codon:yes gene_type:complete